MAELTPTVSGVAAVLNSLSDEIGEWSESKGFREEWLDAEWLEELAENLNSAGANQATCDRLKQIVVNYRNAIIASKLMLTVSELSEALETLRSEGSNGVIRGDGNFGEELADAVIRLGDLAHMIKSPIGDEVVRKVDHNIWREYKHGRKM